METWFLYAVGGAVFAALTTILAKIGVEDVDSHLATAIRTTVVLVFAWLMVFITGAQSEIMAVDGRTWLFLVLSGLATGASWLCFFRALQLGNVNKVVPIDKSSTLLTMILAFVFLGEPAGLVMIVGMACIGIGTWLMLELNKKEEIGGSGRGNWLLYAVLAAVFASLVGIFGRIGVTGMNPNLWTAIRTVVVLPLCWLMVGIAGNKKNTFSVSPKSWRFLVFSGLATGISWLFFYHALQLGPASLVIPIDKLSIVFTMAFARFVLKERFSRQSLLGLFLLTAGSLLPVFFS